jgi:biotin synthase
MISQPLAILHRSAAMSISIPKTQSRPVDSYPAWIDLANQVLDGRRLDRKTGLAILRAPDNELLDILAAAYRVRRRYFGNQVHLNFLINAKSGHCGEDCGYCSQSRASTAPIDKYGLLEPEKILDGARTAAELKSRTYCIVISGRSPADREIDAIAHIVPEIKRRFPLAVCVSPGLVTPEQARRLKRCGVDRVNHNLNTSRRFYPRICSTHSYQERLDTLLVVRQAGLEICSGGIIGMGEEDVDVVNLALELRDLAVEATPINFLQPIGGTPLEYTRRLTPGYCLKALCLFRLANPPAELRIAAGREMHLGPLQPLGLFPANSIFVGDYLTTPGQPPEADYRMIEALGFEAVT